MKQEIKEKLYTTTHLSKATFPSSDGFLALISKPSGLCWPHFGGFCGSSFWGAFLGVELFLQHTLGPCSQVRLSLMLMTSKSDCLISNLETTKSSALSSPPMQS